MFNPRKIAFGFSILGVLLISLYAIGLWRQKDTLQRSAESQWRLNANQTTLLDSVTPKEVDFEEVATILIKRCLECHSSREPSGELALDSKLTFLQGGESGELFDADSPLESYLLERVTSGEMPPEQKGVSQKIPQQEIAILQRWFESGAKWPDGRNLDLYEKTTEVRAGRDWWSLQKIEKPTPPKNGASTVVDAFIVEKLSQERMVAAPPASKRNLLRRLYIDLIGIPPTKEQIERFEADDSTNAFEQQVDSLLASPHFGQRYARYWLDLVRYADTSGYERDQPKPNAWKYRDWIVNAINSDMPYDEFLTQQLAGDQIENRTKDSVIATGFMRVGTWNDEPNDPQEYKYDRLEDLVHATSTVFSGLTVKCARCHDHKFDPILQKDYYRMAAAFWDGPIEPQPAEMLGGPDSHSLGYFDVLGWTDVRKDNKPLRLLHKGDPKKPREEVAYETLKIIPHLVSTETKSTEPSKFSKENAAESQDVKEIGNDSTKRLHPRIELARWLTDRDNPLVARVIVNRIWQRHFGKGLVRSPNNFGFRGAPPTHRKLLDFLAATLIENDWQLKSIHRLILNSETYQQSSIHPKFDRYELVDAANENWWHFERRRLDSESIRDGMLHSSGQLDLKFDGPGFRPELSAEATEGLSRVGGWVPTSRQDHRRRSIYLFSQRTLLTPLMTTFDSPDTTTPCGQRDITTVAPQALALLNNEWVHQQCESLSRDIKHSSPTDFEKQIRMAWNAILAREPSANELQKALAFLKSQSRKFQAKLTANASSDSDTNVAEPEIIKKGLILHYSAQQSIESDSDSRVSSIKNLASDKFQAAQTNAGRRPTLHKNAVNGLAAIRFDGKDDFLKIDGQVLEKQPFTIFTLVNDISQTNGHREIFSNWDGGKGNSGTSLFLGMTGEKALRLTDAFSNVGYIANRDRHFILYANHSDFQAILMQNNRFIGSRSQLPTRNLETQYVIGQQGNIEGEFWHGDICEILVYDRSLSETERQSVTNFLANQYMIDMTNAQLASNQQNALTPLDRALASLCQVLFNTNEFMYVD